MPTDKAKVSKVADVDELVRAARADLSRALPGIQRLAASDDWKEREVAATVLVEVSKKNPEGVIAAMHAWAGSTDPNIRRAASEGLRGLARREPSKMLPVLERLKEDESLYVRKSVASMLRNASDKHAALVIEVARRWSTGSNSRTKWIIKEGLRKLAKANKDDVRLLLASLVDP